MKMTLGLLASAFLAQPAAPAADVEVYKTLIQTQQAEFNQAMQVVERAESAFQTQIYFLMFMVTVFSGGGVYFLKGFWKKAVASTKLLESIQGELKKAESEMRALAESSAKIQNLDELYATLRKAHEDLDRESRSLSDLLRNSQVSILEVEERARMALNFVLIAHGTSGDQRTAVGELVKIPSRMVIPLLTICCVQPPAKSDRVQSIALNELGRRAADILDSEEVIARIVTAAENQSQAVRLEAVKALGALLGVNPGETKCHRCLEDRLAVESDEDIKRHIANALDDARRKAFEASR